MRIIKLSPRDIDFPDRVSVYRYFEVKLPNMNPVGQFLLTQGRIAENGIEAGEPIIFSYETEITHVAKAASYRLVNSQRNSVTYPYYFLVDMKTICLAEGSLADVEAELAAAGVQKNIVHTQGWPRVQDSPAIDRIWNALKRAPEQRQKDRMTDRDILDAAERAKHQFGVKYRKYSGALTVELVREALQDTGLPVSSRDVFIHGVPIEIDLLIPSCDATPLHGLVYDPAHVLAVVEVKNFGSFGNSTINKIRTDFAAIKNANPLIRCCYLTLAERKTYKWIITPENCGGEVFTMFWQKSKRKHMIYDSTGDWDRFLIFLKETQQRNRHNRVAEG